MAPLGFLVKAISNDHSLLTRWLVIGDDGLPYEFEAFREKATRFDSREEADLHALQWSALLSPAFSIVVESPDEAAGITPNNKPGERRQPPPP